MWQFLPRIKMDRMRFGLLLLVLSVALFARAEPPVVKPVQRDTPDWNRLAKGYARIVSVDPALRQITLVPEGETKERSVGWNFETEFYSRGMWGNAIDFVPDQRVFVLAATNDDQEWKTAHAIADEISMQGMSRPHMLKQYDRENGKIVLVDETGGRAPIDLLFDSRTIFVSAGPDPIPVGQACFCNTRSGNDGRVVMELLDATSFASEQRRRFQVRLDSAATNGLAGRIVNVNQSSNRVTALFRRSDSWIGRGLQIGDKARVQFAGSTEPQKRVTIADIRPDQARLRVTFDVPPDAIAAFAAHSELTLIAKLPKTLDPIMPPDLGRFTVRQDRIDYFLSTIYCTCELPADECAGHWNTLAACKAHDCSKLNQLTQVIGEWIDAGLTDPQILDALIKREGEQVLRQHYMAQR